MWDLFWTAIAPDDLGCSNPRRSVGGWHLDCRGRLVHQSASRGTMTKRAVNSDFLAKLTWIGLTTLLAVGCSPDEARLTSGRVKIDLGTHRLEARIEGEPKGRPTVVIESGLGAKIDDWARVVACVGNKHPPRPPSIGGRRSNENACLSIISHDAMSVSVVREQPNA